MRLPRLRQFQIRGHRVSGPHFVGFGLGGVALLSTLLTHAPDASGVQSGIASSPTLPNRRIGIPDVLWMAPR